MTRVLIVDDDPMVCTAIEIYLERHDFDVTIADGGEAGLRALEDSGFDLMLVDIFMPHMRGFESIRIFHERAPTIPLIAMSGYAFAPTSTRRRRTSCAWRSSSVPHAACASRSRRRRCWRPLTNVLPKFAPASTAPFSRTSNARIFRRRPRSIVRRLDVQPPAFRDRRRCPTRPGACIGKTLFTINRIDEDFFGLSYLYGSSR
jgi:CheY-like chemotaxis protein